MNALSPLTSILAPDASAEVLRRDGALLTVLQAGHAITARRALSCLVEPEPGDLVLLGGPGAQPYVLAVLERSGPQPLRLAVAGDAELAADGGRLTLRAETLVMAAREGQVAVQELTLSGSKATARYGAVTLFADAVESLFTRLLTRAKRSYRFVEEADCLRARDVDHRASGQLHLRGETAMLQGGTLARIDAQQIHMG